MAPNYAKANQVADTLSSNGIQSKLAQVGRDITNYLLACGSTCIPQPCPIRRGENYFYVLRRWNSYTPALRSNDENSLGGGYFLSWNGKGIVIDPGFDFIDNLHNAGIRIGCIDAIIITHSHPDHYADFEPLLTLLYEYNDQRKEEDESGGRNAEPKKIHVCASLGTLKKCAGWLDLTHAKKGEFETQLFRIYAMDAYASKKSYDIPELALSVRPTIAQHEEIIADGYSTGFIIDLRKVERGRKQRKIASIALTGDTGWRPDIHKQFSKCDMMVMHIGTVKDDELATGTPIAERLYKKHLGALGTSLLLSENRPDCKLYIVSEFGEEFRESRREIMEIIKSACSTPEKCIVSDIGTKIRLPDMKLMCEAPSCVNEADHRDVYEAFGVVRHYCKDHQPYKSRWVP